MDFNNEDLTSTQLVSINISEDRQYLMLTEKKVINLKGIDLLTHEDERVRQAFHISCIFDRYIDHSRRIELVEELKNLLAMHIIELKMDDSGEYIINVLRNKGQAGLIRLIMKYTTIRKRQTLLQSEPFNVLKHLLLRCMRYQGLHIHINSISVTLSREVNSTNMTSSNKMS